jgi:hypothetical protein
MKLIGAEKQRQNKGEKEWGRKGNKKQNREKGEKTIKN